MKRLVVCCDGTWNTMTQEELGSAAPTNVAKLYNCVLPRSKDGTEQLRYYHPGVGTEGSALARLAGGAYGLGLSRNVMSAYAWLGQHYADGDEVYLFGFSRGAYTARSLSGMLAGGLLDLGGIDETPALWKQVERAYDRYRDKKGELAGPVFHNGAPLPIRFLGVWDTVGSLGIPNDMALLNLLDNAAAWSFHSTQLGQHVDCARHAVAIDERRASFTPTLWTDIKVDRDVQQVWFAGTHSDVGGGYAASGLSDISLAWMLDEAAAKRKDGKPGLGVHPGLRDQLKPLANAPMHDSLRTWFKTLRTQPRAFPAVDESSQGDVHRTVLERRDNPPISQGSYHDTRFLGPGQSATVRVYASERWNGTGVYLKAGTYRFTAKGEWLDGLVSCGPGGSEDDRFHVGELTHLVGSALGVLERGFQALSKNKDADFVGTRRLESAPWFSLIGVVANNLANPGNDGSPEEHEQFAIGEGIAYEVKADGYLYAFANDSWAFYENNRGSVALTITRTG